jgi:hypothetical protein
MRESCRVSYSLYQQQCWWAMTQGYARNTPINPISRHMSRDDSSAMAGLQSAMVLFPLDRTVLVHREHVDAKQRAEAVRDMQCSGPSLLRHDEGEARPLFVRLGHPSSATITRPVARRSSVVVC